MNEPLDMARMLIASGEAMGGEPEAQPERSADGKGFAMLVAGLSGAVIGGGLVWLCTREWGIVL